MNDKKAIIFTAIAVSIVGLVTGLFLGGDLLPSQAENRQYAEETTSTKTETIVVEHSHDGLPLHKHIVKTITETTETTPHGDFHDFAATIASGTSTPTRAEQAPAATEPAPAQPGTITPETPPAPTPAPVPTRGANEVWNFYDGFRPTPITVPVGTNVTWVNKDAVVHNVKSVDGLFDGTLEIRGSFSFTFTKPGVFSYHCEFHAGMAGTVVVEGY